MDAVVLYLVCYEGLLLSDLIAILYLAHLETLVKQELTTQMEDLLVLYNECIFSVVGFIFLFFCLCVYRPK